MSWGAVTGGKGRFGGTRSLPEGGLRGSSGARPRGVTVRAGSRRGSSGACWRGRRTRHEPGHGLGAGRRGAGRRSRRKAAGAARGGGVSAGRGDSPRPGRGRGQPPLAGPGPSGSPCGRGRGLRGRRLLHTRRRRLLLSLADDSPSSRCWGSPGRRCHIWAAWHVEAEDGPQPGAGVWNVSGHCGCSLVCPDAVGASGCPEGRAELAAGPRRAGSHRPKRGKGCLAEFVPMTHRVLLGGGPEPAPGATPAPRPTPCLWLRLARLGSAQLGHGWAPPPTGGCSRAPWRSARPARPPQPSSGPHPAARPTHGLVPPPRQMQGSSLSRGRAGPRPSGGSRGWCRAGLGKLGPQGRQEAGGDAEAAGLASGPPPAPTRARGPAPGPEPTGTTAELHGPPSALAWTSPGRSPCRSPRPAGSHTRAGPPVQRRPHPQARQRRIPEATGQRPPWGHY